MGENGKSGKRRSMGPDVRSQLHGRPIVFFLTRGIGLVEIKLHRKINVQRGHKRGTSRYNRGEMEKKNS